MVKKAKRTTIAAILTILLISTSFQLALGCQHIQVEAANSFRSVAWADMKSDHDILSRFSNQASSLNTSITHTPTPYSTVTPGTIFIDVPDTHWAYDYIESLYQDGYVAGCSTEPRMYCPENGMTRAEGAVFVERGIHGAGYLPTEPGHQTFADVPTHEWFFKWAEGLWEDGYTAGCGSEPLIFCPLTGHTRAEAAVFFERMLHGADFVPADPVTQVYDDVPVGGSALWFSKWVMAAYQDGLVHDCEDDANRGDAFYRPYDGLTRAEAACMMNKAKNPTPPPPPPTPIPPTPTPSGNWDHQEDFENPLEIGSSSLWRKHSSDDNNTTERSSLRSRSGLWGFQVHVKSPSGGPTHIDTFREPGGYDSLHFRVYLYIDDDYDQPNIDDHHHLTGFNTTRGSAEFVDCGIEKQAENPDRFAITCPWQDNSG
ncbi:MAG: hypothetical protein GTO18_11510, partial [Anaerolineales bacterium]|nr:hypothetical protein [Anaerolineales bacterium]